MCRVHKVSFVLEIINSLNTFACLLNVKMRSVLLCTIQSPLDPDYLHVLIPQRAAYPDTRKEVNTRRLVGGRPSVPQMPCIDLFITIQKKFQQK